MKKSNRISKKGAIEPQKAQAKHPTPEPPEKNTDPHESRPLSTRRKRHPSLVAELKGFLSSKSFALLETIEARFKVPIELQLSAALGAWYGYVQHIDKKHFDHEPWFIVQLLNDDAVALDPEHLDYVLENCRIDKASKEGAALFIDVIEKAQRYPFRDGLGILKGLCDLVRNNPDYKGEAQRVKDYIDHGEWLGSAGLYERAGRPMPR